MEATEAKLGALLQDRANLVVPSFQRRYVWGEAQQRGLWDAVVEQYRLAQAAGGIEEVNEKDKDHFVGAFVLMKGRKGKSTDPKPLLVIDGQQRMTSIVMLLCALRDWLATDDDGGIDETAVAEFNADFLHNGGKAEGTKRYRLVPQEPDRDVLLALLDGFEDVDASHPITRGYSRFLLWFEELYEAGVDVELDLFTKVVFDRMAIVDITLDDKDNVHRIFQTLNSTGVRLHSTDLLKNYFFMLLGTEADEVYEKRWKPMEDRLGKWLPAYLLSDLIRGGKKVSAQGVFDGYQELLRGKEGDAPFVKRELQGLVARSEVFGQLLEPSGASSREVAQRLGRLNRWGVTPAYPMLHHLLVEHEADRLDKNGLLTCLDMLESFLVRRFLAQVPPNDLRSIFSTLTATLAPKEHEDLPGALRTALRSPSRRWPTDDGLRKAVVERPIYEPRKAGALLYVMARLAEQLQGKETPHIVAPRYTIEHVMPQKLTDAWERDLRSWGDDPKKTHAELLHVLGNLTTTGFNSEMRNFPFGEQKTKYLQKSGLQLNADIVTAQKWSAREITARGEDLARTAVRLWPGPAS